jgi:hypothetical protein
VTREELESATHELDERSCRQEFRASFESLNAGMVYYAFERAKNVEPLSHKPQRSVFWSLDFNVNPMCSVIGQRDGDEVRILDELVLPDSHLGDLRRILEKIAPYRTNRYYPVHIDIYGDATGSGRRTAAARTDWQIVQDFFLKQFCEMKRRVPSTNPPVKDRVNRVNAMLRNQAGERRLLIDPKCKELILDFERVHWKSDAHGNALADIDKSDPARSHLSDALGYMIAYDFGMRGKFGEMPGSPPR